MMSRPSPKKRETYLEELADAWLSGEIEGSGLDMGDAAAEFGVDQLLTRLATAPDGLSLRNLLVLSDLTRQEAALVHDLWSTIPVDRRRTVIRELIRIAEEDLSLQLGRLLRIALDDDDPTVRRLAIEGLAADEDLGADLIGPLVQALHAPQETATRVAAARALGAYVLAGELDELDAALAMRVEEALMTTLLHDDEPLPVRCSALESLAYSGEIGMRQLIEDAYYAPEEEMRVSALNAMGRSADVRWRNLARAELQNPAVAMRAAAATASGALENRAAVSDLTDLLADDVSEVRLAAISALGQIGGKEVREILEAMRLSDDPAEAEAADLALEELMFFADGGELYRPDDTQDDTRDDWDDEPWSAWFDTDDANFGAYEADDDVADDDVADDDTDDAEFN